VKIKAEMKGYNLTPSKGKKKNYLGGYGREKRKEGNKEKIISKSEGGRG
jgi:hypothetical protein